MLGKYFNFLIICLIISIVYIGSTYASLSEGQDMTVTDSTENDSTILIGIPDVRQAEYYSCGAAAFQATLNYYGINSFETDIRTMLNTSITHGTYSWDIERVARDIGFSAEWKENVSFADVENEIRQGFPVIVRSQRILDSNSSWSDTNGIGHYMIVFGFDNQYVYLEDPYILGSRLRMPREDFIESWHTYVTDIPPPSDAPIHSHEVVFIRGTIPQSHPEYIGPAETHPIVQPVPAQPPIVKETVV